LIERDRTNLDFGAARTNQHPSRSRGDHGVETNIRRRENGGSFVFVPPFSLLLFIFWRLMAA
jgi:hypothetical protein